MSPVEPPLRKPGDDLDGMLRAFFRSQLPHPWPSLRLPSRTRPIARPPRRARPLFRSRLALAASIALLVLGALVLPGRFSTAPRSDPDIVSPEATYNPPWKHRAKPANKSQPDKLRPGLSLDDDDLEMLDLHGR